MLVEVVATDGGRTSIKSGKDSVTGGGKSLRGSVALLERGVERLLESHRGGCKLGRALSTKGGDGHAVLTRKVRDLAKGKSGRVHLVLNGLGIHHMGGSAFDIPKAVDLPEAHLGALVATRKIIRSLLQGGLDDLIAEEVDLFETVGVLGDNVLGPLGT